MIRLGFPEVSLYPNTGIVFENYGGTIVLKDNVVLETIHTFLLDLKPLWNLVIDFQLLLRFSLTSYDEIIIADCVTFWLGCFGHGYRFPQIDKTIRRL